DVTDKPIASEIQGFQYSDFSDNTADGRVKADALSAFAAGHYWASLDTNGPMLISRNRAFCTGDKPADGESIAFDANYATNGFSQVQKVTSATAGSVSVDGVLKDLPYDPDYSDHWVNIVDGTGVGQARRISKADTSMSSKSVITVTPAWDVVPDASSRITVT